ncbi:hypothetical protein [Mesorhizobium sp.]|uniref:hypothetical protein n=1 Tax=Mesorhizobium sp. TaxID=1871066 RepID=UPI000FE89E9B|nr:hypothetical protein [Mesorhizobium sp.]RWK60890.1 MAG: hypothetical protein EOR49_19145 [Mesorhizobium sp.]RWM46494.1 MAG: hypothetical protein EOR76_17820 [Mesorhizobium sp.]RWM50461.1 MAG: hypothetical protein EOR78_26145 [Mesorhizobium sp.]RWM55536.1 MAG: hypothetical protein EOR79_21580 [Mesorhizobium sp.]RWM77561.1 MAG: hypothetical protein EOR81_17585 [Mesorhizobium sp.]
MNGQRNQTDLKRNTTAIAIWENEGGAPGREFTEHQYGRRVEADRSWTVYHVFTGVTARVGDDDLIGLSRSQATSRMMSLNLRNAECRKQRISLPALARDASGAMVARRA